MTDCRCDWHSKTVGDGCEECELLVDHELDASGFVDHGVENVIDKNCGNCRWYAHDTERAAGECQWDEHHTIPYIMEMRLWNVESTCGKKCKTWEQR